MKTLTQTLKTITLGLTVISAVSYAHAQAKTEKYVAKAELMRILKSSGLKDGAQQGLTADGKKCDLNINTEAGLEDISLQTEADEYAQRLIFDDELSDILFRVRLNNNSIAINQDFSDSFQDVQLNKISESELNATFTENIAGDERTSTCVFKK